MGQADAPATDTAGELVIHLVRHGETDWNRERRVQGWTDIPLNARGVEQARAAATALAGRPIATVISSDLSRARRTAELICARTEVPITVAPDLREQRFGVAEGRLDIELDGELGRTLDQAWSDPDFAFEGGETQRQTYARLERFLTRLRADPPPPEIVLVSHGGALRLARGVLEGLPVGDLPTWRFGNGEVTTLRVAAGSSPAAAV